MLLLPQHIIERKDLKNWVLLILNVHKTILKNSNEGNYILPTTSKKLESIITSSLNYYSTLRKKLLTLYFLIIKGHPFLNANKRTAVAILLFLCEYWNIKKCPQGTQLKKISLEIAKNKLTLEELFQLFDSSS